MLPIMATNVYAGNERYVVALIREAAHSDMRLQAFKALRLTGGRSKAFAGTRGQSKCPSTHGARFNRWLI